MGESSTKLGPCEVCGKHVTEGNDNTCDPTGALDGHKQTVRTCLVI